MNDFLREFVMETIREMVEAGKAKWEVRKYALDWYSKEVLTEEDLKEIDEMYKPAMTEDVTVENTEPISEENSETVEDEPTETEEEEQ